MRCSVAVPLLLAAFGLAGCSNALCVQVDTLPVTEAGIQTTGPGVERIGAFNVGTRFLDPTTGGLMSERTMLDAAVMAAYVAGGPGAGMLAGYLTSPTGPVGVAHAEIKTVTATLLQKEQALRDQGQAIAELSDRVRRDLDPTRPDAVSVMATSLVGAYAARRPRILMAANAAAAALAAPAPAGMPAPAPTPVPAAAPTTVPAPAVTAPAAGPTDPDEAATTTEVEASAPAPARLPAPLTVPVGDRKRTPGSSLPPPRVRTP